MIVFVQKKKNLIRGFSSSVSNAKYLALDTPNSKKPPPSSVLNAIIFGIDEQCNLIFETTLFTNCKTYNIFLFNGVHFLFFLLFLFPPHFFLSIQSQPSSFLFFSLSPVPLFSLSGFVIDILELASAFLAGVEIGKARPLCWLFLWLGWVLWWVLGVEN